MPHFFLSRFSSFDCNKNCDKTIFQVYLTPFSFFFSRTYENLLFLAQKQNNCNIFLRANIYIAAYCHRCQDLFNGWQRQEKLWTLFKTRYMK